MNRRPLLVLRPEPGASATAAAARGLGLTVVVAPLFAVRAMAWRPPAIAPDAVLMTSANAARHGGAAMAALASLPLYAVGRATEAAARAAGFSRIVAGDADAGAIVARAAADGRRHLLHLAGRDHRRTTMPGLRIDTRIVYASEAVRTLPDAARAALPEAVAALHSPRAAALFAALAGDRVGIAIAALSGAVADAAGEGWRAIAIAARPDDATLLAAAAKLCDHGHDGDGGL